VLKVAIFSLLKLMDFNEFSAFYGRLIQGQRRMGERYLDQIKVFQVNKEEIYAGVTNK